MKFWCLQISQKANQIFDRSLPYLHKAEICLKFGWLFGRFEDTKFHSEINWPLPQKYSNGCNPPKCFRQTDQWLGYDYDSDCTAEKLVGKFVNQYLSLSTLTFSFYRLLHNAELRCCGVLFVIHKILKGCMKNLIWSAFLASPRLRGNFGAIETSVLLSLIALNLLIVFRLLQ